MGHSFSIPFDYGPITLMEVYFMKRKSTRRKTDKKIFRETAKKTKTINVSPVSSRGGVKL